MRWTKRVAWMASAGAWLVVASANAQFAVIDVGAIAQLILQVAKLEQQLETAHQHLRQAELEFESMTGSRGLQRLLSGVDRNYLPADWAELDAAVRQVSGSYQALASSVQALIEANSILTPEQVVALSPEEREQLEAARRTTALLQATARQALEVTSHRFDDLEQLIDAIGDADDQKSILELHARIAAEQAMLANEQTKLQVLYQTAQAEEHARQQRTREQAMHDVGSLRQLPAMGL